MLPLKSALSYHSFLLILTEMLLSISLDPPPVRRST